MSLRGGTTKQSLHTLSNNNCRAEIASFLAMTRWCSCYHYKILRFSRSNDKMGATFTRKFLNLQ
jgi:hypothetical protein